MWRFTTLDPYIARDPVPANNKRDIPSSQILSWQIGIAANSHDVYIGTEFNDVNGATTRIPCRAEAGRTATLMPYREAFC